MPSAQFRCSNGRGPGPNNGANNETNNETNILLSKPPPSRLLHILLFLSVQNVCDLAQGTLTVTQSLWLVAHVQEQDAYRALLKERTETGGI
jgi:hypothetical protein